MCTVFPTASDDNSLLGDTLEIYSFFNYVLCFVEEVETWGLTGAYCISHTRKKNKLKIVEPLPMPLGKKEVSIYLSMNFINLRLRNASDNNVINIFIIKNNVPSANLAIGTEDIPFLYPFLSVLIISNITD